MIVVLFNATDDPQSFAVSFAGWLRLRLARSTAGVVRSGSAHVILERRRHHLLGAGAHHLGLCRQAGSEGLEWTVSDVR